MKALLIFLFTFSLLADNPDPLRFEDEINAFKESDKNDPPQPGSYLFIGSSSIKIWKTLKDDFAGYPVLNRGFGGSHFSDAIYYFNDIVKPYEPSKIIIYEGDNDIASEKSIDLIFSDFKELLKMINKNLNDPEIAVIAAKPSPQRWHLKNQYEALNLKLEKFCSKKKRMTYIDVFNHMLTETGIPNPELFLEDSLHMNKKGYEVWTELLLPFIEK